MLDIEALNEQDINVWGYVRVSTKEQKLDRQLDAMTAYGVPETHIWEDHETGKTFNRPEYKKMIRVAQRGDIVANDYPGYRLWDSCTGYAGSEHHW